MGTAVVYPMENETLAAHQDTVPLPFAKLARRLAQLPTTQAHRVMLWYEKGELRWAVETIGAIENRG